MIEFNCEKCDCFYKVNNSVAGKTVRCKKCGHVMNVPLSPDMSFGYVPCVEFKADGITPDFDDFFAALANEERTAPPLVHC